MSDFRNYLNEQLQRPSFKAEWDTLQPELTIAQAMIDARKESGLTQKQLSERTGIAQADISKLERGNAFAVAEKDDFSAAGNHFLHIGNRLVKQFVKCVTTL